MTRKKLYATPEEAKIAQRAQQLVSNRQTRGAIRAAKKLIAPTFIAIDGEGTNAGHLSETMRVQNYTLLQSSTGDYVEDYDKGLSTPSILFFLTEQARLNPTATFTIYGGNYDFTMWLRDLTFDALKAIRDYQKVDTLEKRKNKPTLLVADGDTTYAYTIIVLPRKMIEIKRYTLVDTKRGPNFQYDKKNRKIVDATFVCYDVIGFFQGSPFITAIGEYNLELAPSESAYLAQMKAARGTDWFDKTDHDNVRTYCKLEVDLLVKLMQKLAGYFLAMGLTLKRWDGAGAAASAALEKYEIPAHNSKLPDDVLAASLSAFSGGRIELVQYGHVESKTPGVACLYDDDVNSAYPTAMVGLPSFVEGAGVWSLDATITSEFALVHVKWNLGEGYPFYPFFYRTEEGLICYPSCGENWVHLHEYNAYRKHEDYYRGYAEVVEVLNYTESDSTVRPFAFVAELAAQRLEWKKEFKESKGKSGGQQLAAKLTLNSFFGKTAQQIGGGYEENEQGEMVLRVPKCHNMYWAGYITSHCRAKVYDHAMQHPESIVMFATDGVFTLQEHECTLGVNLGEWERTPVATFTAVQSGVYYYRHWRNGELGPINQKTRGFRKAGKNVSEEELDEYMSEEKVMQGWKDYKKSGKMSVSGKAIKFITFGMLSTCSTPESKERALATLACWETTVRQLQLLPTSTKRVLGYDSVSGKSQTLLLSRGSLRPDKKLVRTQAMNPWDMPEHTLNGKLASQEFPYYKMDIKTDAQYEKWKLQLQQAMEDSDIQVDGIHE
jgi:hypothetical protein